MEIGGDLRQLKAELGNFFHRPREQLVIVGLEVELSALRQHLAVLLEEIAVGEPPLFLVALGPRITKVDVQAIHLAGGEHIRQQRGVAVHEEHVFQSRLRDPLHGHHHGVRNLLHGDEQHIRLRRGGVRREPALAAAQLHPQLPRLRHQRPPLSPHGEGIADEAAAAGLHPGYQIFLLTHTHGAVSSQIW